MILASQSPRRQQLLQLITHDFTVHCADVNESGIAAQTPALLAKTLAFEKAQAVFLQYPYETVIGCDTVVDLAGKPLGKPKTEQEAKQMLTALSGNTHLVHTGVCIFTNKNSAPAALFTETSEVTFSAISPKEIDAYVETGDCFDKAGSYGIQGQMAAFIPKIKGCYYNVMGLPVAALYQQLKRLQIIRLL